MAGSLPTVILLSKTDLSESEIAELSDGQAWKIIYSLRNEKVQDSRLHVCFTGFGVSEKLELSNLAQGKNMNVAKSVTKKLDFLVGGENAGPVKLAKAEAQGAQIMTKQQFFKLVETGELPETN